VTSFSTSPGTRDILPPDAGRWRAFQGAFEEVAATYGYRYLIPPMFEDLGVFLRLGEATDVVTKEMYDFEAVGVWRFGRSRRRACVGHTPSTGQCHLGRSGTQVRTSATRSHSRADTGNLTKLALSCWARATPTQTPR
jgi:hypothetical protein